MAEKKTEWVKWIHDKIGEHPADTYKFGMFAWEYAFYRGDQYRYWDQTLGLLREVNINREARCIYNACRPFVNLFVAKMLKGDPIPRFMPYPDNTEEADKNTAAIGNGISTYWWKTVVEGSVKLRHQCQWGGITGIGIGKIYYDENKNTGNYTGDVEWLTVNPFHFFVNPDARNDDEIRWAIHRFPREKSTVEDDFGKPRGSLKADEKQEIENKRVAGGKRVDDYISSIDEDCVFVHDIWIKTCKDYPNGKHVVVAGGEVLVDDDNDMPDTIPFMTFRVKPLPDEFYGDGILKDILNLQRDMNRVESIVQENASVMGVGHWMVNRSSGVIKSAFNNAGGGVIEHDGDAPQLSQGIPVPEQIANRWWDIYRKMFVITGFNEAGRGDIPYRGSQTSPGVIKELKQSEEVNFAQDVAEMTDYIRRVMRRFFTLARKYYPEQRMVEIMGANRRPEVGWFNAQEFIKDPDFDVAVGSGFTMSQEAKMDQMIQFATAGLFDKIPNFDWESFGQQIMEYGGLNKLNEDTFLDEKQAKRALNNILSGQDVALSPYANLPVHIKVFTDYIKQPEWEDALLEQKAAIDGYIQQAQMMMMQQQMAQMQQMAPMMGPGNGVPQENTASEENEASNSRRQATGQPGPTDMEQAGQPAL